MIRTVLITSARPAARRALYRGAIAHLDGRLDEALTAFHEAITSSRRMGSRFELAVGVLAAAAAAPADPRVLAWGAEARTILEPLGASALLARLDEAFAAPEVSPGQVTGNAVGLEGGMQSVRGAAPVD